MTLILLTGQSTHLRHSYSRSAGSLSQLRNEIEQHRKAMIQLNETISSLEQRRSDLQARMQQVLLEMAAAQDPVAQAQNLGSLELNYQMLQRQEMAQAAQLSEAEQNYYYEKNLYDTLQEAFRSTTENTLAGAPPQFDPRRSGVPNPVKIG